jgi:hypothetical protein
MYGSISHSPLYELLRLFLLVLNRFLGRRMAKLVLLVSNGGDGASALVLELA